MMQSRAGFSLLEILIVTTIAALLAGVLFTSFWQTQRLEQVITDVVTDDQTITRVYNQFEKDINGFFIPALNLVATDTTKKPEAAADKEKPKRIAKVFASTSKNKMLALLTFTTDNVFSVYKKQKPLVARVVYRLEPSRKYEGTFALTRQEFAVLDTQAMEDKNKAPQAYMIADSIVSLILTYEYTQVEQPKEAEPPQKPGQPPQPVPPQSSASSKKEETLKKEVHKVTEWDSDAIEKDKESKQPLIPTVIVMELIMRNVQNDSTSKFTFTFPVLVAKGVEQQRKAKPKPPPPPIQPPEKLPTSTPPAKAGAMQHPNSPIAKQQLIIVGGKP